MSQSAGTGAAGTARQVARSEPVKAGARVGLVAYGITYLLIAWLALQVAFGGGTGEQTDQNGAFQTIASQPIGRVLLWALVIGFAAVALWRLEQTIFVPGGGRDGAEKLKKRLENGARTVLFAVLAVLAARTALGSGESGTGQQAAAGVLGWPGGRFLVGAIGTWGAVEGQIPLGGDTATERVQLAQALFAVVVVSLLVLAATLAERESGRAALAQAR